MSKCFDLAVKARSWFIGRQRGYQLEGSGEFLELAEAPLLPASLPDLASFRRYGQVSRSAARSGPSAT
jgi:hypothetical protein